MAGIFSVPNQNAIQKTLDSVLSAGATSLTLNESVAALFSGVSATNPCIAVIDRVNANGVATPDTREYVKFTGVSGAQLTGLTRGLAGSTDIGHAVAAVVEFVPDVLWAQSIKDAFETDHTTNGAHKFSQVLDSNSNETLKLASVASAVNEVTGSNAATNTPPSLKATGGDTNIDLLLDGKGTGTVKRPSSASIQVLDGDINTSTGDGKAYFTIPEELNGFVLSKVHARVVTAGTTNTTDIQIHNVTDAVDMLSTKLTIDSTETGSDTAAVPAVIDTASDDVATNDLIRIDIDAVSTTPAKGLIVRMQFKPA